MGSTFVNAISPMQFKRPLGGQDLCGSLVTLDCGVKGSIQGRVLEIDNDSQLVTISQPFQNGFRMKLPESAMSKKSPNLLDEKFSPGKFGGIPNAYQPTPRTNRDSTSDESDESFTYVSKVRGADRREQKANIPLHSIPASVLHDQNMVEKLRKFTQPVTPCKSSQPVEGFRINVSDLLTARPSSSRNSISDSGQTSPGSNVPKYKQFGQFKLFEQQQVPEPCHLRINKNRRADGPCGIPVLDAGNGYGQFSNKHPELEQPLDFKLLNTDFDFDANLALFNKEVSPFKKTLSDDESSSPELQNPLSSKSHKNFRHDENILDDPARVISWLSTSNHASNQATMFKPLDYVRTTDGFLIPVLSAEDKERYMKESEKFLGADVFYSIIADRLLLYLLNTMDRFEMIVKTVAILASESTHDKLLMRMMQHLSNRFVSTIIYAPRHITKHALPYMNYVDSVAKLPTDPELILKLDNSGISNSLQMWLKRVGNGRSPAHIISIDEKVADVLHSHSLFVETLVDSPLTAINNGKQAAFREATVTEMGTPFCWFEDPQALADSFGGQVFVNI